LLILDRRSAAVTANVLAEYKELIKDTTSDLEEHLQAIDNKLQVLCSQDSQRPGREDAADQRRIKEERESTERCLEICASVLAHIEQVQTEDFQPISTPPDASGQTVLYVTGTGGSAEYVTARGLKNCKDALTSTTSQLQTHLQDINVRLQNMALSKLVLSDDHVSEQDKIREEMEGIKQCLAICAKASEQATQHRTHVIEDVSADDDVHQVIVATFGDLLDVKHVKAGARSSQWVGQMSDVSLQQLSRDRSRIAREEPMQAQDVTDTAFQGRYGTGHTLSSTDLRHADKSQSSGLVT
jgi:hypothetical protein